MIQSEEHKKFRRDGHNLHTSLEINLYDALFGFTTTIEHLDGHKVIIKRVSVTQPESVDEIKTEGMPITDEFGFSSGRTGSLFVRFILKIPTTIPSSSAIKKELEKILKPKPDHDEL
jgi:DnaJ family protein B protein 11